MSGQLAPIGPFVGGLNTFSDPSSVADNELVVANNVELDLDGSIKSRPPFVDEAINFPLGTTGNIHLLGYYYTAAGVAYLLASNGLDNTYYFNGSAWTTVFGAGDTTFSATAMVQFDGKAWLLSGVGDAAPGGYWTPTGDFTADVNMPHGEVIVNFKFRLWVAQGQSATANPTRLYRSRLLSDALGLWTTANDFLDVGAGDGQGIVQIIVYFNTLLIFRTRSIWSFSYSVDPADGTLSQVVGGIGLIHKDAIAQFESYVYFMFEDRAYEFTNGRAAHLNIKVPFASPTLATVYLPYAVSEFNRRIVFSFYGTMFVFNLQTRTWTTWTSAAYGSIGKIIKRESEDTDTAAFTHSSTNVPGTTGRNAKTLTITDVFNATDSETIACAIQTKNLDYSASSSYKRLFWWGIDAVFRGDITGIAAPITYTQQVTWGEVRNSTWGDLLNFTWGQPQSAQYFVETVRSTSGTTPGRRFVKFLKSLRFRQVYFRVTFTVDGTTDTSPVRIFHISTFVKGKETVSKAIT